MNEITYIATGAPLEPTPKRSETPNITSSFDEKVMLEEADRLLRTSAQYDNWELLRQKNDNTALLVAQSLLKRHSLLNTNESGGQVDWKHFDDLTLSLKHAGIHLYDSSSFHKQLILPVPSLTLETKTTPQLPQPKNAVPTMQQVYTNKALLTDENSLIFNLTCPAIGLQETAFGYGDEHATLLPLGELSAALDFQIRVDANSGTVTGWFISEDRTISLDIGKEELWIAGSSVPLQKDVVFAHEGEIYVDSKVLSTWLPLDFTVSRAELNVEINPREKLPLQESMEREQRRLRLNSQGMEGLKYPVRKINYDFFSVPVMDFSLSSGVGEKGLNNSELQANYSVLGRGDLFYMNSDLYVSGTEDDPLNVARIRLERVAPNADMLGPLHATQIGLGDILPTTFTILENPSAERGVYLSNSDLVRTSDFNTTTLEGNVLPGWEVELYYNNALIDSLRVQPDGRYSFEDVPLFYGNNEFRVLAYGPQGQKKVIEEQSIPVGSGMLPEGQSTYDISLSQRRKTVFGIDEKDTYSTDNSVRLRAKYTHGMTDAISLSSGVASVEFNGERHNYLQAGVSGNTSFLYGQADYLYDTSSGSGLSLLAQTSIGPFDIRASHEWFSGFVMESRPQSVLDAKTTVDIGGVIPKTPITNPISYTLSAENISYTDQSTGNLSARFSSRVAAMHVSNTTNWHYNNKEESEDGFIDGVAQISGNAGPVRVIGGVEYDIGKENKITKYNLSGHWPIDHRLSGGLNLIHDDDFFQRTTASAKIDWDTGSMTVSPRISYDSDNTWSAFLSLSFSLGMNSGNSDWTMSSEKMANSGTAQTLVYHDANNNQVFDEGDKALSDVDVLATQARKSVSTGEDGRASLTGLSAYSPTDLEIDVDTLEDPFWQPSLAGTAIRPRPGHVDYLEFPVVSTGEIDGTIYSLNKQGAKVTLSSVQLDLVDSDGEIIQSTRSEYDGFYLFEKVFPGKYLLRVSPNKQHRTVSAAEQEIHVTIGNDGTIVSGTDFRMQGPETDPQQKLANPVIPPAIDDFARVDSSTPVPVPVEISAPVVVSAAEISQEIVGTIADASDTKTITTTVQTQPLEETPGSKQDMSREDIAEVSYEHPAKNDFQPFEIFPIPTQPFVHASEVLERNEKGDSVRDGHKVEEFNEREEQLLLAEENAEQKLWKKEDTTASSSPPEYQSAISRFEVMPQPITPFQPIEEPINIAGTGTLNRDQSVNSYKAFSAFSQDVIQGLKGVA